MRVIGRVRPCIPPQVGGLAVAPRPQTSRSGVPTAVILERHLLWRVSCTEVLPAADHLVVQSPLRCNPGTLASRRALRAARRTRNSSFSLSVRNLYARLLISAYATTSEPFARRCSTRSRKRASLRALRCSLSNFAIASPPICTCADWSLLAVLGRTCQLLSLPEERIPQDFSGRSFNRHRVADPVQVLHSSMSSGSRSSLRARELAR